MKTKLFFIALTFVVGASLLPFKQKSPKRNHYQSQAVEQRTLASSATTAPLPAKNSMVPSLSAHSDFGILLKEVKDGLVSYQKCYDEGGCVSDDSDARAEDFTNTKLLQQKLVQFSAQVQQRGWQSSEVSLLARELLNVDDGAIKEQALDLLLSQQPEPQNVDAIAHGIFEYHDSNLVERAVAEFQRHLEGDQAVLVHQSIRSCLLTGSLFVRESVSAKLGEFVNSGSYQFYLDLSNDPAIEGTVRRNLRSTLLEYQLSQSDG